MNLVLLAIVYSQYFLETKIIAYNNQTIPICKSDLYVLYCESELIWRKSFISKYFITYKITE